MLAFSQKFSEWKDFPRGLHVMVVDADKEVLNDLKLKLEACDYVVTLFSNGHDALAALQSQHSAFHVAVVEATSSDALDGFKIVDAARHLPTIMMSNTDNLSIMMQGIAAGASEFLQKPLSEEKLKNIWQHVVRKALCTGELVLPEYVSSRYNASCTKIAMVSGSVPQLVPVKEEPLEAIKNETLLEAELFYEDENEDCEVDEKPDLLDCNSLLCAARFPGPSTPQLEQASRGPLQEDALDGSPLSHDFNPLGADGGDDSRDSFDECDNYLRDVKTEVEDGMDELANVNGFFDSIPKRDGLDPDDFEKFDSKMCSNLQFDDNLQLHDNLGDIILGNDLVDGDVLSGIDMDSSILDELSGEESAKLNLDCLHGGDLQEADEEALLLAEVARAEVGMISCNSVSASGDLKATSMDSNGDEISSAAEERKAKRSDSEQNGKGNKSEQGKRKMKVDWTPELHRRFVQAVEQLGVDKAIPSRILELMNVQCLTRHNIASHLQKYRSHKKHLLAREAEAATWNQRRQLDVVSRPQPSPPPPQIQPRPAFAPLHVWGHPTVWPTSTPTWQVPDGTFWHHGSPACMDAWGHPAATPFYAAAPQPLMRLPLASIPGVANMAVPIPPPQPSINIDTKLCAFHPARETVDAAINEVLRNPFVPLPLGLKPPSLESVISELQRQGVKAVSPAS